MPRPKAIVPSGAALLCAALLSACSSGLSGAIPVEQYRDESTPSEGEYVIGVGDTLSVQVWDQPQMSAKMRVRNDGRITLPFVNDVQAAGKTSIKLATDLEGGLKSVVVNPRVTVVVEDTRPLTISVLGEVSKPGTQSYERDSGVAQAIAAAGGLTNFAKRDRIFVIRTAPKPVRIHFKYDDLIRGVGVASQFRLKPGDVVSVE